MMILDLPVFGMPPFGHAPVFLMDGFFCCKGWLKLKISSFFKTPKLFLLCFQILSIFIQAPMVPSHTQDSPWGLLCEPPAGRRLSLQDGEGASRQCSNPDWSARHAASSIVPLQALTEALQSESVLLPVGKPVRVCLCVCHYMCQSILKLVFFHSLAVSAARPGIGSPVISPTCCCLWGLISPRV